MATFWLFEEKRGNYSDFLVTGMITSPAGKFSMTVRGCEMKTEVEEFILLVSTRAGESLLP